MSYGTNTHEVGSGNVPELPSAPELTPPSAIPLIAGLFALTIFIIDTFTPLGFAIAVLYSVVVLMASTFCNRRGVLLVSAICMTLTVLSYFAQHKLAANPALVRALMSLSAIGATTALALQNQAANTIVRERARLLDLTHDTVFVRDVKEVITYWNHGAEELYGWTRDEAIGRVSHELMKTVFPVPLEQINAELLRTGRWEGELVHTRRDGTRVNVASRWSLQRDERGRPVATMETNNDITGRKHADAELRASERRFRNIFQAAAVSIWEEDFSQVKAAIDDLKAQGVTDIARHLASHPELVRDAVSLVKIVNVNDATVKLFGARDKNELLVSLHKVLVPESELVFAQVMVAIAEGRSLFESETALRTLQGDALTALMTIAFPPESYDCVLVSLMDITERNRTQEALQQAQAELAHVTRVTTLGQLTASIAHEVNQPLAAIVTNGEACLRWLGRQPPEVEEVRGAVESMISDGRRASDVVSGLRALSRKTDPQRAQLDLNGVIDDVVLLVQREVFNHRVVLRLEHAPGLPPVPGDRVQLQQVVMNLVVNGLQAMAAVDDRPRDLTIRALRRGNEAVVEVRDSGSGIDPVNMGRLFGAFFTTKDDGMGMGLSICRSIIEAHGGRIWASHNDGHGATFQFTLPLAGESPAPAAASRADA